MNRKIGKLGALVGGVSALAMGMAAPAAAQDAETSGDDEARRLNTVEITATRREGTTVQDVPIAVTALDPETLERAGVADLRGLDTVSPSFNLNSSDTASGGTTIRVRGVGTTGNNIGLESSVAVFLDGVYLSRPGIALADLVDVAQIEVLRGPQGTLFGRNTSAGALNITTQKPNFDGVSGFGNATVGNFDLFNLQAGLNVPVSDNLAFRVSGAIRQRDGYLTDINGNDTSTLDRISGRAQALYDAGEAGEVRLILDYAKSEDECCDAVWFSNGADPANFQALGLVDDAAPNVSPDLDDLSTNSENFFDPTEQLGFSWEYTNDFGFADFTYIGSWRDFNSNSFRNTDYTGLNIFTVGESPEARATGNFDDDSGTDIVTQTHEARLQGLAFDDRLDWLVGGYYSDEQIDSRGSLTLLDEFQAGVSAGQLGGFVPLLGNSLSVLSAGASASGDFATNVFEQDAQSLSVFTHNVLNVTDDFNVTVGLRYVDESKDASFDQVDGQHNACLGTLNNFAGINGVQGAADAILGPGAVNVAGIAVALNCFVFAAPTIERLVELNPGIVNDPQAFGTAAVFLGSEDAFNQGFDDDELVYTIKAGYSFNDNINVYGGFTHGFKSGGFNLDASAGASGADPRFDSEKIDAFEIGLKSTLLDGSATFNLAAFHQILSDFQVLEFTGIRFQTFNVGEALSTGVEVESQYQLNDNFGVNLGVTWTDARYPGDCATFDATDADFNINAATLCGNSLTNAPDFVTIFGANYEQPIANGAANFFATGSVRHETDRRTSTQAIAVPDAATIAALGVQGAIDAAPALAGDIQDANTKVNLRLGVEAEDERWAVELWGVNIFDERTKNVTFNIPLRANSRGQFVQEPATYGLTLRTKF